MSGLAANVCFELSHLDTSGAVNNQRFTIPLTFYQLALPALHNLWQGGAGLNPKLSRPPPHSALIHMAKFKTKKKRMDVGWLASGQQWMLVGRSVGLLSAVDCGWCFKSLGHKKTKAMTWKNTKQ